MTKTTVPVGVTTVTGLVASLSQAVIAVILYTQGHESWTEVVPTITVFVTGGLTLLATLWGRYKQAHQQIANVAAEVGTVAGDIGIHVTPQSIGEEVAKALEGKALVVSAQK
jgi:hypothetical protein